DAPALTTWETEGLAVAEDRDAHTGTYIGLVGGARVLSARGTTLLVRPEIAVAQLEAERRRVVEPQEELEDHRSRRLHDRPRLQRFYGVISVDPERLGRDAGRIAEEVVAHLNGVVGTETEIVIEIRSVNNEGFPEEVVRIVNENAITLRFRHHDF